MVLQRFIKFVAQKAVEGSVEHEQMLTKTADKYPEITDDAIGALIEASRPVEVEDWPILPAVTEDEQLSETQTQPVAKAYCSGHHTYHPVTEFWKNARRPNGYHSSCIAYYTRNKNGSPKQAAIANLLAVHHPTPSDKRVRVIRMSMSARKALDAIAPEGTWICVACRSYRPVDCFNKDNTKPQLAYRDYARTICKDCQNK